MSMLNIVKVPKPDVNICKNARNICGGGLTDVWAST